MLRRYPRTPHLPWSEGGTPDDVRAANVEGLCGRDVVVTEKLDGENTTLYRDHLHARSLDLAAHPSRTWIKAFHDRVRHRIPDGWRVSGEGLFAKHALHYGELESFFYVLSVWRDDDRCLDWDTTVAFAKRLGAPTPRVLYRGCFDAPRIRALTFDRATSEGYVVRASGGFAREEFVARVAKFVRKDHVVATEHWARAPVVPNGLSARALLWDIRAGLPADTSRLGALLGIEVDATGLAVAEGLDVLGRSGDARLEGVLAGALARRPRTSILQTIAPVVGTRVARRVADLVGVAPKLHAPFPDDARVRGLRRIARAVDVGVLHVLARATARDAVERDLVGWSELVASDAGLLGPAPLAELRADAKIALDGAPRAHAQRRWSAMLDKWMEGRVRSIHEGLAATHDVGDETGAHLTVLAGPSGSGKSTFVARRHMPDHAIVSLDALREASGDRGDQTENGEILARALADADTQLARGRQVTWDATSLTLAQRALVLSVARRRGASTTIVVALRSREALERTNASRAHKIPVSVLTRQLERFQVPYPAEADRILYLDANGTVADTAGDLFTDELES